LLEQPRDALRSYRRVLALVESFDTPEARALIDALEVHA
jgi:hypothetical protein